MKTKTMGRDELKVLIRHWSNGRACDGKVCASAMGKGI